MSSRATWVLTVASLTTSSAAISAKGARDAEIPVFAVHGVNDNAARVAALDWFLDRRRSSDKLWLGQWDHGSGCCPNRRGDQ